MSQYRLAVDVGGTFTDLIVQDKASGSVVIAKTASIPHDPAAAIIAELARLGHLGPSGEPYGAESVKRMLAGQRQSRAIPNTV